MRIIPRDQIRHLEWTPGGGGPTGSDACDEYGDPGLLEIIGGIAQALGLAEQIQRVVPTERLASRRRHARIDKRLQEFKSGIDDARAALRLIKTTIRGHVENLPSDAIGINVPTSEVPLYRRGLAQLLDAVKRMTNTSYELETITQNVSAEQERFYRISQAGRPVLNALRRALGEEAGLESAGQNMPVLEQLLDEVDGYLGRCSNLLEERNRWLQE